MKKKTKIIISVILILLIICSGYLWFENTKLQISHYKISSENITNDFNDFKIIQISDFHNTKSTTLTNDLIKEIEKQKPNIIVLTGDLIDANRTDIDVAVSFVKGINHIAPIYFVSGNHEAGISNYSELKEQLTENKVTILDNKTETLKLNDSEINLIGIDDPQMVHEPFVLDSEIIQTELNYANYDDNKYSVLLSHRPEVFSTYANSKVDLVLSGHAHGGQIRIPFVGGLIAPNQGIFPKYTSGIFEENETSMIVSRGIGNSILPFRINNRPELVVIQLHSKND